MREVERSSPAPTAAKDAQLPLIETTGGGAERPHKPSKADTVKEMWAEFDRIQLWAQAKMVELGGRTKPPRSLKFKPVYRKKLELLLRGGYSVRECVIVFSGYADEALDRQKRLNSGKPLHNNYPAMHYFTPMFCFRDTNFQTQLDIARTKRSESKQ